MAYSMRRYFKNVIRNCGTGVEVILFTVVTKSHLSRDSEMRNGVTCRSVVPNLAQLHGKTKPSLTPLRIVWLWLRWFLRVSQRPQLITWKSCVCVCGISPTSVKTFVKSCYKVWLSLSRFDETRAWSTIFRTAHISNFMKIRQTI